MGFRFRLEKVLWWREELERRKLRAVSLLEKQKDLVALGLKKLQEEKDALKVSFSNLKGKSTSSWELSLCGHRSRWIWEELEKQREQLKTWDKRLELARKEWEETRRDTEVIKRLKARAKERFLRRVKNEETKLMDEAALRNYQGEEASGREGLWPGRRWK